MSLMFSGCSQLETIDLSNFNTQKVRTMSQLFNNCSSLISLDLNYFNTTNVGDMSYIFRGCSKLENITFNFNTINALNMNYMFADCTQLKNLDLSTFNTLKCNSYKDIFLNCNGLTIYIKKEYNNDLIKTIPEYIKIITEY